MRGVKAFVDTNILVYLYSNTDETKRQRAYHKLEQYDCQISTQVLYDFSHVFIKKWKFPVDRIQGFINQICSYCDTMYITEQTIEKALGLNKKYGYSYYDCLMLAAAIQRGCQYLLTEDMSDEQVIEDILTINNIFAGE
jgi:predicted nucleic acid-binding protein